MATLSPCPLPLAASLPELPGLDLVLTAGGALRAPQSGVWDSRAAPAGALPLPLWHRDGCWSHPHLGELHGALGMLLCYLWLKLPLSPLLCVLALPHGCTSLIPVHSWSLHTPRGLQQAGAAVSRWGFPQPKADFTHMSCPAEPQHPQPSTLGVFLAKVPSRIFHLHLQAQEEERWEESARLFTASGKV